LRGSWRNDRKGVGVVVVLVVWVVTIALIWALMQGQATSGALSGVIRVSGLTIVSLAAESALDEASIVLRNPAGESSPVLDGIKTGSGGGDAHDPTVTRELFAQESGAGLAIEKVRYKVVHKGDEKGRDPWLFDLSVRVTFTSGNASMSRQVSRRHSGKLIHVRMQKGRRESKPILSYFTMDRSPLVQVIEP
jgi:hypothetical protein